MDWFLTQLDRVYDSDLSKPYRFLDKRYHDIVKEKIRFTALVTAWACFNEVIKKESL